MRLCNEALPCSQHPVKFSGHKYCESHNPIKFGDYKHCDVFSLWRVSQGHVIKWSRDLMGESLSWHATILPSLLVMCIVVVEI